MREVRPLKLEGHKVPCPQAQGEANWCLELGSACLAVGLAFSFRSCAFRFVCFEVLFEQFRNLEGAILITGKDCPTRPSDISGEGNT